MGNSHTSSTSTTDSIRSHSPTTEDVFKVDNINSYGRKHASAKIQISFDDLCIRQKRRQSLHIPLETIKRYGIDGSIFILECGRRAPMGPARYAFRCKHAERLVDALDQHITTISRQLSEQTRQDSLLSSSSTLTNVSSTITHGHCCHHRAGESQRRRTQSDHTVPRHAPSSILISSSSSSSISLTSGLTDSYRNSEPNLSENYLPFEEISHRTELSYEDEQQRPFFARLKQPIQRETKPDLNYIAIKAEILPSSTTEQDLLDQSDIDSINTFEGQPPPTCSSYDTTRMNSIASKTTTSYVYIDHEKTTTLKDIARQRLQQHSRHAQT